MAFATSLQSTGLKTLHDTPGGPVTKSGFGADAVDEHGKRDVFRSARWPTTFRGQLSQKNLEKGA